MKNLILFQPIVKANLWLLKFLFFINQKLYSVKQSNQTSNLTTTNHDSITLSEALVLGELFQHWVDELRDVREIPIQLQEYFFSPPNSEKAIIALQITIQKCLHEKNKDQLTVVLDVIKGMKKTIQYYKIKDFETLAEIIKAEKKCFETLIEGQSNDLVIKNTLSKFK